MCILSTLGLFGSIYGLEKNHQRYICFNSEHFGEMSKRFKFTFILHAIFIYWIVNSYFMYHYIAFHIGVMLAGIAYHIIFSRRLRQLKKIEEEFKRLENYESD